MGRGRAGAWNERICHRLDQSGPVRWFHLIVGIAWIGASFHFIWLDFSLRSAGAHERRASQAPSWMVHGGGFYHVEKYMVAPATLPPDLHWFKWEAYLTFISGFGLLIVQYYFNASTLPGRPGRDGDDRSGGDPDLDRVAGGGWFVYDAICRSRHRREHDAACRGRFALIVRAAFMFTTCFLRPRRVHPCRRDGRHDHGGQRVRVSSSPTRR